MEDAKKLLDETEKYVRRLLREDLPPAYLFHNLDRTLERVQRAKIFIEEMELPEKEAEVLLLALWFLDTGYTRNGEDPLENSIAIARSFLQEHALKNEKIEQVTALIKSTAPGRTPRGKLEKVIHDIKWFFLGQKAFFGLSNLLRMEKESLRDESIGALEWHEKARDMLVNTNFYTPYAREEGQNRKIKNIAKQREKLVKARKKRVRRKTGKDFGRGVDTIYRVTFRNHINLSRIADGKANMIISINTVVLSVLITVGSAGFTSGWRDTLTQSWYLFIPVVVLMLTSLTAVVFAVLSALPKVSSAQFSDQDLVDHKISMLYFGNFLQLKEEKFVSYLRELKKDQEILYDDLSRDLYNLGAVLRKKYRLLTYAYRIFVGGLVLSLGSLLIIALIIFL